MFPHFFGVNYTSGALGGLVAVEHCKTPAHSGVRVPPILYGTMYQWCPRGDSLRTFGAFTPGHLQPNTVGLHETCPFESLFQTLVFTNT